MSDTMRLLVVDDEEVICHACGRIFSRQGFVVEKNTDACEALKWATERTYAAVLLDIKMPKMNGIQFLEKLRENNPEVPVLIMTGYPSIPDAAAAIRLGASDYIIKPFTPEEITQAVQRMLGLRRPAETEPTRPMAPLSADTEAVAPEGEDFLFLDEAWLRLEKDGSACVGAVLPRLQGAMIESVRVPKIGEVVYQGLPLAGVSVVGKPAIPVLAPISGVIAAVNERVTADPSLLSSDPCGEGWIACICTTRYESEAVNCRPRRLVLVNSDAVTAEKQAEGLAALGCGVRTITEWKAAAAAVREGGEEMVLVDAASLGASGPEVVRQVNALAPARKVVVIASAASQWETAYRKHRIFYYAVEPFADNEVIDILDAAFRRPEPSPAPPERGRKVSSELVSSISITNRNGHKVRLLAAPGLLRRSEGLGGQIWRKLLDRMFPIETTPGVIDVTPNDIVKTAGTCDRLMVLLAKDTGHLPGTLARDIKAEFVSETGQKAGRVTTLMVQPDEVGGLTGFDGRTTAALTEHIVQEMASY